MKCGSSRRRARAASASRSRARILQEARDGVRFDDIAVVLRAPADYVGLLEDAFDRAGIPGWFERGARRPHPAGRAFLAHARVRGRTAVGDPVRRIPVARQVPRRRGSRARARNRAAGRRRGGRVHADRAAGRRGRRARTRTAAARRRGQGRRRRAPARALAVGKAHRRLGGDRRRSGTLAPAAARDCAAQTTNSCVEAQREDPRIGASRHSSSAISPTWRT